MTATRSQGVALVALPAGKRLTVTMAASSTAIVERMQGESRLEITQVDASQTRLFGEYLIDVVVRLTCLTGSLVYSVSQNTGSELMRATQTNDDAAAGDLGEHLISTLLAASAVSETSNTPVDVTTLALTAGDWDVSGVVNRVLAGVTATRYAAAISPTVDTVPAQAGGSGVAADSVVTQFATFGTTVTGGYTTVVGPVRVSLADSAVIHLVAADLFSVGTVGVCGTLRARRVR